MELWASRTYSLLFWNLFILTEYWWLSLGWSFCWVITRGPRLQWWGLIWCKKTVELGCWSNKDESEPSQISMQLILCPLHIYLSLLHFYVLNWWIVVVVALGHLIRSNYAQITSRGVRFALPWFCCPLREPVWCIRAFSFLLLFFLEWLW